MTMPVPTRSESTEPDATVADLEARLQAALDRQAATAEILSAIANSPGDAEQSLHRIAEITARLFAASSVSLLLADGDKWGRTLRVGASSEQIVSAIPLAHVTIGPQFMPGAVYLENRQVHVPDLDDPAAIARWPGATPARAAGTRTMSGTPLRREGRAIGAMIVHRDHLLPFTAEELTLLQGFADQAAIAVENARLINETREALERQTATAEVLRVISQSPTDVQPVFDAVVSAAVRLLHCDICFVLLRGGDTFSPMAGAGPEGPLPDLGPTNLPIDPDANFPSRAILGKTMLHLPDWSKIDLPEHERRIQSIIGVNAALYLPLLHQDECIGLLALASKRANVFSESDIELAKSFRDQALIAIQNTRMFNETREALERQTATADILKVIASSPSHVQPVFEAIAERANRLIGGLSTAVLRVVGDQIHLAAFTSMGEVADRALQALYPRPVAEVTGVDRLREGRTVQITDTETASHVPERIRDLARRRGYRSILYTPLILDRGLIGIIVVTRREPGPFDPRHGELLKTFADQAVIAIRNARLINETREALERQTATADILKVIASSPSDVQPVFEAIATRSKKLVDALSTTVFRLVDGIMHLKAFTPVSPEADAALKALFPAPLTNFSWGEAVRGGGIHRVVDTENEVDSLRDLARLRGFRSMLFVPLLRDGAPIGLIAVTRVEPGPFADNHVDLLKTFADQAVIAIQNVQLFDEVQAKTRDLSEALDQQTATADVLKVISRSVFDLQSVLDTLVESACALCGTSLGLLYLRGDDAFECKAIAGAGVAEARRVFMGRPIRAGRGTAAERVIMTGEVHSITDFFADPEMDPRVREMIRNAGGSGIGSLRSTLAVPMMRDDTVVGVIVIARTQTGPFPARQVELLQTFADQAVIAIENARLFDQVQARTRELSASLENLRTAQDRLVQTEKLASLGQLTAGIAHEIKNPLNFVNNFSALSIELIDEMLEVLKAAPLDTMMRGDVDELSHMLKNNLDKVVQHGSRADSIVKNMLLHSREGSGEHRPADINALVEESLNLAYHGARAEKSGFNITLRRDFDPAAGEVVVFPQEITRVFLNLISNGFYATARRMAEAGDGFEPVLVAATKNLGDSIEIRIRDNGTGIPPQVKEKMFNPFFTTKPAGEGTGLGLSMSHDIIVKQHGGTIEVETAPGQFTEFIVTLPRAGLAASGNGGLK
ncbi:MAG: GAF domain-containing protein [Xanthobacteraceae bacterium]